MKLLYYMDPFLSRGATAKTAGFNGRFNLNPEFIGKEVPLSPGLEIQFVCHDDVKNEKDLALTLSKSNIGLKTITTEEIDAILAIYNLTHEQIFLERGDLTRFTQAYQSLLASKLGEDWTPDLIIAWENTPKYMQAIFPDAIGLEGHHSGFHRFTQQRDVMYHVLKPGIAYHDSLRDELQALSLPQDTLDDLAGYRETFKKIFTRHPHIDRAMLDPSSRFTKLLFYPGHLATFRRTMYTNAADDSTLLQNILKIIPRDWAIVYSAHPLSGPLNLGSDAIEDERLIDISELQKTAPHISVNILEHVDAVINVSSNYVLSAMLLHKPVFDLGGSWLADYSYGRSFEDLAAWATRGQMDAAKQAQYEALADKFLWFVLTRKVPVKFFQATGVVSSFWQGMIENIRTEASVLKWLPIFNSLRGAAFELEQGELKNLDHLNSPSSRFGLAPYYIRSAIMSPQTEVVGFDIFDTLLCRPTIVPVDVFDTMSPETKRITKLDLFDFRATRIMAERLARQKNKLLEKIDVTFDEIYVAFREITGLSQEQVLEISELEKRAEKAMLRPRYSAQALFDLAQIYNKKIVVVSDMYLPSSFLREVLTINGYRNLSDVFVSNEHNAFKRSGELFKIVLEGMGVSAEKVVYIGDNYSVDVEAAKQQGIRAFHYPKAIEQFNKTLAAREVFNYYVKGAHYCFHIGLIANKIFDDPFIQFNSESLFNKSSYLLGYLIFGPLVLSKSVWLAKHMENGSYERLFFAARDGYLVQKAYDALNERVYGGKLATSSYYYASRKASIKLYLTKALVPSLLDVYKAHPKATVRDYINSYFGIDVDSKALTKLLVKHGIILNDGFYKQKHLVLKMLQEDTESFAELMANTSIVEYTRQELGETPMSKSAFFDIGTRATTQKLLSMHMQHRFDIFLFRQVRYTLPETNNVTTYATERANPYIPTIAAVSLGLSEIFFACPYDTSVTSYAEVDGRIEPVLARQQSSFTQNAQILAQRGAIEFYDDFIELYGDTTRYINEVGADVYLAALEFLSAFPSDRSFLEKLEFSNPLWLPGNMGLKAPRVGLRLPPGAKPPVKGTVPAAKQPGASVRLPSGTRPIGNNKALTVKEPGRAFYFRYLIFGSKKYYDKFNKTPHKFFADSKNILLRQLRHFYKN